MNWMDGFVRRRTFRSPIGRATETIGIESVLWVLFLGPIYYWRKGALIEGIVLFMLTFLPFFVPDDTPLIGSNTSSFVVWGLSVLLAPTLLSWSYERRGWDEITQ
jgi:hypothetical protein